MNKFIRIAIAVAATSCATLAFADKRLEGAWEVEKVVISGGADPTTVTDPQASLYIFAKQHYSIMLVPGSDPRPIPENDPYTEEEILTAFRTFIANSGAYEVNGSTISFSVLVARAPTFVGVTWPSEYKIEGDLLTLRTEGNGSSSLMTLKRLD